MYVPFKFNVTLRLTVMRPSRQGTPRPGASVSTRKFSSARVVLDACFRANRVCLTHISVLTVYKRSKGNVRNE